MKNENDQAASLSHTTVLLHEAVDALQIKPDGFYVDGTFGRGGHSSEILKKLGKNGRLLVIDKDPEAIRVAKQWSEQDARVLVWHGSFKALPDILACLNLLEASDSRIIDGILLDLGVSSPQLDDASRGFSFMREGLLDMRMNPEQGLSVAEWLKQAQEKDIADVLWSFGEEKQSRRIAKAIISTRDNAPLETTLQLANLISSVMPRSKKTMGKKFKHPATRSFQALRIYINHELSDLESCLERLSDVLNIGGRMVIISFHSLEDRMVKRFIKHESTPPKLPRGLPVMDEVTPMLKSIGKAIKPSVQETESNPRSRSAVMRVAERQI